VCTPTVFYLPCELRADESVRGLQKVVLSTPALA